MYEKKMQEGNAEGHWKWYKRVVMKEYQDSKCEAMEVDLLYHSNLITN